jgi:hypothetical protein
LLEYSVQLLEDIKNNRASPELSSNFVETIQDVSRELARHIHIVSQLPTLPFEANSYSSFESLNALINTTKLIQQQIQANELSL